MKQLIIILYLLVSLSGARAQVSGDFMARSRHYIGVNAYPVISRIMGTDKMPSGAINNKTFEIFYKRQVEDKDRAWRFGLLLDYIHYDEKQGNDTLFFDRGWSFMYEEKYRGWAYYTGVYVGHEWQTSLGKRWLLGYGLDVKYLFTYDESDSWYGSSSYNYSIQRLEDVRVHNWGNYYQHQFYLNPFIEINFAITPYFIVSTGCSMSFVYSYNKYDSHYQNEPKRQFNTNERFHVGLQPFQRINLIYSF